MLKLIIEDDEGRKTVVPFVRDEITIGRQEGNTIRLTERNVSRRHARLLRQSAQVLIEDLGSYNGIRVNGDRIKGQVPVNDGDLIQIGDYDLAISREEEKAVAPTVPLTQPARASGSHRAYDPGATIPALPVVEAPTAADEDVQEASPDDVRPALGEDEGIKRQSTAVIRIDQVQGNRARQAVDLDPSEAPRLVALNTDFAGREFPLTRTEVRIGRTDENDIGIDHRSLSRNHCKIVREDSGEWRVIDLQSANGVMVNGESYAQVALTSGDVVELGHLKLKFLGPGEEFSPSDSDLEPTAARHAPAGGSSKGPIVAVVATLAVVVLGAGGYVLFFKSTAGGTETERPVKTTKPPRPGAQLSREQIEAKLSEARAAIAELDFDRAEQVLKSCKLGESLCPEANQLLTQMDGERGFKNALERATVALKEDDLDTAKTQLDAASSTVLLKARYQELEARRAQLVKDRLAAAPPKRAPEPVVDPPRAPPPPPPPPAHPAGPRAEVEKLLDDAREYMRAKNFTPAINRLEKCVRVDPKAYQCHKLLGSAYAYRGTMDHNDADVQKGLANYEKYLKLAPPDAPDVAKVRKIVDTYRQQTK